MATSSRPIFLRDNIHSGGYHPSDKSTKGKELSNQPKAVQIFHSTARTNRVHPKVESKSPSSIDNKKSAPLLGRMISALEGGSPDQIKAFVGALQESLYPIVEQCIKTELEREDNPPQWG